MSRVLIKKIILISLIVYKLEASPSKHSFLLSLPVFYFLFVFESFQFFLVPTSKREEEEEERRKTRHRQPSPLALLKVLAILLVRSFA